MSPSVFGLVVALGVADAVMITVGLFSNLLDLMLPAIVFSNIAALIIILIFVIFRL